jgi:hypothetical protein
MSTSPASAPRALRGRLPAVKRLAIAASLVLLAGCGGGGERAAVAFQATWPHGVTLHTTRVAVPGDVEAVYLGAIRLDPDEWTCIGGNEDFGHRARYSVAGSIVSVTLDDGAAPCSPRGHLRIVGGYGPEGGYIGDWSAGAILFRRD